MRAAVVDRYGAQPRLVDIPRPVPRSGEVLVRVRAAAVTSGDARLRSGRFPAGFGVLARLAIGVRGPRRTVLGGTFAGEVEVGSGGFAPGELVCGMNGMRMGAHAEYVAVAATRLARVPAGIAADDAAGVLFGGSMALHAIGGRIRPGSTVLVNGASGAVGTNAVQLARHHGALVTGVCSAVNASLVESLGAHRVIDYRTTDLASLTDRFDLVLDTVGTMTIASGRRLLTDQGVLVLAAASLGQLLRAHGRVVAGSAPERATAFAELLELRAAGDLRVVHDASFDLADIAAAYERVDSGRKVGNIVVHP